MVLFFKKKILFIIGLILLVTACQSELKIDPNEQITIGIENYPSRLDPRYPGDAYSSKINQLLFNGLLKYDENLNLVPDLAERYEYISETQLVFKLQAGITFHNGKTLNAQDVLYTYQSILDPENKSPLKEAFSAISEIKTLDDLTIEITLNEPFAPILPLLTIGIVPEPRSNQANYKTHPADQLQIAIGTGPYQFFKQKSERWILLKAFKNFYDTPPKIKWLKFELIPDETMRALKLSNGELDLIQNAIPIPVIPWLQENSSLKLQQGPGINYKYLGFNLRDPILKNLKVRQAIAYAIHRDSLIQYKLKGLARPATGLLAPENPYYTAQVKTYPFDPTKAKQLLDEAGFKDPDGDGPKKRFTLIYKTSTARNAFSMAKAIAEQLEQVGIGVEIRAYEWATFYRDIRTGNFQLFSLTWVGIKDPDIFYYAFHSSQVPPQGSNRGYYQNSEVDKLIELARIDTDENERFNAYTKIQEILAEDLPYVSLWYEDNVAISSDRLVDYQVLPDASFYSLVHAKINQALTKR